MCNVELNKTDRFSTWIEGDPSQYSEIRNVRPGTPRFEAVDYQSRAIHLSVPVITPLYPAVESTILTCVQRGEQYALVHFLYVWLLEW